MILSLCALCLFLRFMLCYFESAKSSKIVVKYFSNLQVYVYVIRFATLIFKVFRETETES